MTIEIFDRTTVVEMLRANCLGMNGMSGVVIGTHKVGKTHLLNHLAGPMHRPADALVCRLDLDLLRASVPAGERVNDAAFFRFLTGRIAEGLATWLAEESEHELEWRRGLEAIEAKPVAPGDPAAESIETATKALRDKLNILETLRKVAHEIDELLAKDAPLAIISVARVLEQIKRTKRRVVLFIDEFNRLLVEPGLTDRVFSFLRGAANEQKMVTLGTSAMHLMDASLHPTSGVDASERMAFFNHYYVQRLSPFAGDDAARFLSWLHPELTPPLTEEERDYLLRLGGGSPYFLKMASDQFLTAQRPKAATRPKFEREMLAAAFETGFRVLWQRCTPQAREALRGFAKGESVAGAGVRTLESEGYLVSTANGHELFTPLFADFIGRVADDAVDEEIEVLADFRYRAVPRVVGGAAPGEALPVRFRIRNPTSRKVTIVLTWSINGYSLERSRQLDVGAHSELDVAEPLNFQRVSVTALTEPTRTQLQYRVSIIERGKERQIALDTPTILMLAADNFVFARRDAVTQRIINLTWVIAAWVTRDASELVPLRQAAGAHAQLVGYGGATTPRAQVEALYKALVASGINYQNSTMVFHHEPEDFAQRV